MLRLLPGIIDLVLTVVAIVDIVLIDPSRVRGLPKWAWVVISILLFIVACWPKNENITLVTKLWHVIDLVWIVIFPVIYLV